MSVSTLSFNSMTRSTLVKLKTDAATASYEMLNERYQDVGLALGRLTGTSVSYRVQESSFASQIEVNKLTTSRLEQAQDVMDTIRKTADDMTSASLVSTTKYSQYSDLATSALQSLQVGLNTDVGGFHLFAGKNADGSPIPDIDKGIAAAKQAYDGFLTAIGKTSATVSKDELGGFLGDGYTPAVGKPGYPATFKFSDTVNDANWATNWSSASDTSAEAAISSTQTIPVSISANEQGFRQLVAGYSMLAVIKGTDLNSSAQEALRDQSAKTLTAGRDKIVGIQAVVGTRQTRVETANDALTQQKDVVTAAFTRLEGVDQTEASLRYQSLETQLNAAYTITGRLQKLSILNYL